MAKLLKKSSPRRLYNLWKSFLQEVLYFTFLVIAHFPAIGTVNMDIQFDLGPTLIGALAEALSHWVQIARITHCNIMPIQLSSRTIAKFQ